MGASGTERGVKDWGIMNAGLVMSRKSVRGGENSLVGERLWRDLGANNNMDDDVN
jgi:hypothetical protein